MKGTPLHQSLIVKTLNHTSNSYNLYHTTFNRIIFFNHRQNGTLFLAIKPCNVNSKIMTPSMNEKLLKKLHMCVGFLTGRQVFPYFPSCCLCNSLSKAGKV